ncbi:MAG: hypothetical protein V4501_02195 [Pseudomonadota bacterium]
MTSEINSLRAAAKTVLRDIAKHAHALASGLQNAAPPQDSGPGKSILYLTEIGVVLQEASKNVDAPSSSSSTDV